MSKMGWESAKVEGDYGPPPRLLPSDSDNCHYSKAELMALDIDDLEKLDDEAFDYWSKIRAVVKFRRLD
jgi:hypothetical protein